MNWFSYGIYIFCSAKSAEQKVHVRLRVACRGIAFRRRTGLRLILYYFFLCNLLISVKNIRMIFMDRSYVSIVMKNIDSN